MVYTTKCNFCVSPKLCELFFRQQHEDASVKMFDHMIKVNNLLTSFIKYNLTEKDVVFIKELIAGTALDGAECQVTS